MARRATRASPRETPQQKRYSAYQAKHPDWADDPRWKQKARGHKAREHVERKRREIEKTGLTSYQRGQIRKYAREEAGRTGDDEDEIFDGTADIAGRHGFEAFKEIRDLITRKHRESLHRGKVVTFAGRAANLAEMEALAAKYGIDVRWLYYR